MVRSRENPPELHSCLPGPENHCIPNYHEESAEREIPILVLTHVQRQGKCVVTPSLGSPPTWVLGLGS